MTLRCSDLMLVLSANARDLLTLTCAPEGVHVLRLTGSPFELMAADLVKFDYCYHVRWGSPDIWTGYIVRATEKGRAFADVMKLVDSNV